MRTAGKIVAYALGVVVVGALLAPPLWWAGRWAIEIDLIPQLKGFRFAKYFNRAVLVTVIFSVWPFLRWLGLRRWTELGLDPNKKRWRDLGIGLAVGLCGLYIVAGSLLATDHATFRTFRWAVIGSVLLTATIVPLLEEPFFRGVLLGLLRRSLSWYWALGFLSFVFAVVHFIKPQRGVPRLTDIHWYSGFELLPRVFWQFGEPQLVLGGWITLFLVGWILGYTVIKTRSLYMAIGLHAGWVFALRSFSLLTKRKGGSSIWVGAELTVGILPILLLLTTFVVVFFLVRNRDRGKKRREAT